MPSEERVGAWGQGKAWNAACIHFLGLLWQDQKLGGLRQQKRIVVLDTRNLRQWCREAVLPLRLMGGGPSCLLPLLGAAALLDAPHLRLCHSSSCLLSHGVFLLSVSVSICPSSYKNTVIWDSGGPPSLCGLIITYILITSAETLFPNKVAFTDSGVGTPLSPGGHISAPNMAAHSQAFQSPFRFVHFVLK